jgi:glutaredoxin 3
MIGHGGAAVGAQEDVPLHHARVPRLAILYEVMAEITVYTTEPCSFCGRVKEILAAHGAHFTEVNLAKDAQGRMDLVGRTGMMTFPQVLVGEELLGGFKETLHAAESGRLERMLAA